jgi:hypothetical protein
MMNSNWKKLLISAVMVSSLGALAGNPGGKNGPAKWEGRNPERAEEVAKNMRMFAVVSIAEALSLNEADALKLSEKLKAFDERRQPVRQQMREAMQAVKAAADGDQAALGQVDANIQKVLDGRAQMAALDKELFLLLGKDQTPQNRAKLALALAKLHEAGGKAGKGRRQ